MKLLGNILIIFLIISASTSLATDRYVAPGGSNSGEGPIGSPWLTIQYAENNMDPGDICYVRAGTYRETVTINKNNITIKAYNGETVVVNGCDLVTGWSVDSGNIYKSSHGGSLDENNGLFVNGQMMTLARWPNRSLTNLYERSPAIMTGGNETLIWDTNLVWDTDNFFAGGHAIVFGQWAYQSAGVSSSGDNDINLSSSMTCETRNGPGNNNNYYYVCNFKKALDSAGEYYHNGSTIYLWQPGGGSPSLNTVELKQRDYGFVISSTGVTIEDIDIFGCSINLTGSECMIKSCEIKYICTSRNLPDLYQATWDTGILIQGDDNTIRDCEIGYSTCNLVDISGDDNKIINNYMHDGNIIGTYDAMIDVGGAARTHIAYNTITRTGRDTITLLNGDWTLIEYNDISYFGIRSTDCGALYNIYDDLEGTEVRYNTIHDSASWYPDSKLPFEYEYCEGLYIDEGVHNYSIHHNVCWNIQYYSIQMNHPCNYNLVYSNKLGAPVATLASGNPSLTADWGEFYDDDTYGSRFTDNICEAGWSVTGEAVIEGNTLDGFNTNAYAPTGHDFASPPNPTYALFTNPYRNRIVNSGFDRGTTGWITSGAGSANNTGRHPVWDNGSGRITSNGGYLRQNITGLERNTIYEFAAIIDANGSDVELKVANFGGSTVTETGSSSDWTWFKARFQTGPSGTEAQCTITRNGGSNVNVDDVGLVKIAELTTPMLTINYPYDGLEMTSPFATTVTVSVASNLVAMPLTKIEFFLDGTNVGQATSHPYSFPLTITGNGDHYVHAKLTDNFGTYTTPPKLVILKDITRTAFFDSWDYDMKIWFTNDSRLTFQTNFPVLVKLNNSLAGFNYSQFRSSNGADLRFSDGSGLLALPYDIQEWNESGDSYVWVQIPKTAPGGFLNMHWGRAGRTAPSYSTDGSTWTDSGYMAVWHMDGTDGANNVPDALGNNHGTRTGSVTTTGAAGDDAQDFEYNDTTDIVTIANESNFDFTTQMSASVWFKAESLQVAGWSDCTLFDKGAYGLSRWSGDDKLYADFGNGNDTGGSSSGNIDDGAWHHSQIVFDTTAGIFMFSDGELDVFTTKGKGATINQGDNALTFGGGGRPFDGIIDEVRFSTVPRSEGWAMAEYMSIIEQGSFLIFETAVSNPPVANSAPTATADYFVTGESVPLIVNLPDTVLTNDFDMDMDNLTAVLNTGVGGNGTLNFSTNGSFWFIPGNSVTGLVTFTYYANDGVSNSASAATVSINVTNLPSPPPPAPAGYRMKVSFPGYTKGSTLTDIPLLVVLNESIFNFRYSDFLSTTGNDLRFRNYDQSKELNYEIEEWNTNGNSYIWVEVDSLATDGYIWAYWANPTETTQPTYCTNGSTWSNGYVGVYHMNEAVANGATFRDSTTDNDGTMVDSNGDSYSVAGAAANGVHFTDDLEDYIGLANESNFDFSIDCSVSVWTTNFPAAWKPWVAKDNSWELRCGGTDTPAFSRYDTTDFDAQGNSTSFSPGWHMVAGTYDGTNVGIYVDDKQNALKPCTGTMRQSDNPVKIASKGGDGLFTGAIDEVRISSAVRSSNWVWTVYENMANNSSFCDYPYALFTSSSNVLPVANNDYYSTASNTLISIPADGVLTNDTDGNLDSLTAVLDVGLSGLSLNSNGSFTYTPDLGVTGLVSFTYYANDGTGDSSSPATATINVTNVPAPAVNNIPVATNDYYSTASNTLLSIPASGVLTNDFDADFDSLNAVLDVGLSGLSLNGNGSFTYTPDAGVTGLVSFTYYANDGTSNSASAATATINVTNVPAPPPPPPPGTGYKMKITMRGYNKAETLTDIPMLVILNESHTNFSYGSFESPANGYDLRFKDAAESQYLNYEIESWDTNGNSYVWVQVKSLDSGDHIWAYWGDSANASQPSYSTDGSTWSNGYVGVYHMSETPGNGVTYSDSTTVNDGTMADANGDSYSVSGAAAGGVHFTDGPDDYITLANESNFDFTSTLSVSCWTTNYPSSWEPWVGKYDGTWQLRCTAVNSPAFCLRGTTGNEGYGTTHSAFTPGWHFVAGTYDGTKYAIYVDDTQNITSNSTGSISTSDNEVRIGSRGGGGSFSGAIDEVRISSTARSSNWMWAVYENMADNDVFCLYGETTSSGSMDSNLVEYIDIHYSGTSNYTTVAAGDTDGDGFTTEEEYTADTDPTNNASAFKIVEKTRGPAGHIIRWKSSTSRWYCIYKSTNLLDGWITPPLVSNYLGGASGTNAWTNSDLAIPEIFYKITVDIP